MSSQPTAVLGQSKRFYGWRIVAFATVTATLTGPGQTIGVSVFVDPMIDTLRLTRSQVAAAYLIGTVLGALALPSIGRWIDRVGTRPAVAIIGAGFGAALVAMGGVFNFLTLAAGFTFIRMLGQGSLSLASTVAVSHWFQQRRGLAIGIFATLTGGLMGLTPVFLNRAIESFGWRVSWTVAAAVVVAVVVPIGWFGIVSYPSDIDEVPDGAGAKSSRLKDDKIRHPPRSATRAEALGSARFWVLSAAAGSASMLSTALNFHQISLLGAGGLSAGAAALMFLPQVIGASIAGFSFGALTDRVSPHRLIAGATALLATTLFLASVVAPGWVVIAYATCLGLAGGSIRSVSAALLPKWFGVDHLGAIQGFMTFLVVLLSAVGPVALSVGRDWFGSYGPVTTIFALIPLVCGTAALVLLSPRRSGNDPSDNPGT